MALPDEPKMIPVSVAVLMGGKSSRFGSPKAFLPYRGGSLAAYLLKEASCFSDDVFPVCRTPDQVPPDAREFPIVTDQWEQEGPLSGLHAALQKARYPALFLTGVDMPFLSWTVVKVLWETWETNGRPDATAPHGEGHWEPLCSVWGKGALGHLAPGSWRSFQAFLDQGPIRALKVDPDTLRTFDPELKCLKNFNSREEWEGSGAP